MMEKLSLKDARELRDSLTKALRDSKPELLMSESYKENMGIFEKEED
jgi:hypothetical protein